MDRIRKEYRLPEEVLKVIETVKKENNFKSETEALVYIISAYRNQDDSTVSDEDKEKIADLVIEKMQSKFKKKYDRVRLASSSAEKYTYILLDAMNTLMYETKAKFLMKAQGYTRHEVIKKSEEDFKAIIERNKQIKDNEELKKGE